jgi:hypothetical protein
VENLSTCLRPLSLLLIAVVLNIPTAPAETKVLKWVCTYTAVANPGGVFRNQSLALTFSIDDAGKHAVMTGNRGTHNVELYAGTDALTFVDRLKTGAIQVTTIDSSGKSVHSQHTILGGLLIPSQSYGKCVGE